MAHTGQNVYPAAAAPFGADPAPLRADAGREPCCMTSLSSGDRNAPADVSTVLHAEPSSGGSSAPVYPSSCAVKTSPSASLSPIPEQTPHAAEHADMPTLLIICLSPELLSSPSHDEQRGQRLQQQQSAKHLQQSCAQRQVKKKLSQTRMGDALQEEPEEQRATNTQTPVAMSSRACLPSDSAAYIFLAEQFLPSLGLPMSWGDGSTVRQGGTTDVRPDTCAHERDLSFKGLVDHQHSEVPEQEHKHHQYELQRRAPRACQDIPQPRLHELPTVCLLQTKYYEAPLRLLYQFFEPPTFDTEVCTPNVSSSAAGGALSQTKSGTLLQLAAPPEAVLLLCRNLADLYRAHELVGTPAQQRDFFNSGSASCSMHEAAAAAAEVAAANGDTLSLPHVLRHSPYILVGGDLLEADRRTAAATSEQVAAPAAGVGAAKGGEAHHIITATNEKPEGPPTFPGRTQGVADTVEEGEATGENWLSSVPLKLLVCFDAEEENADATPDRERGAARSSYSDSQPNTVYEDYEDPSVILFFENSCFLEKVSLSLPTRCLRDSAASASDAGAAPFAALEASRDARAAAGATAADETTRAATSRESEAAANTELPREAPAWCSVRPLLGTTMPLLRGKGIDNDSVRALQRLVEALHCHLWPNMRLLPASNKGSKTGTMVAPTIRRQREKSSTNLQSSLNGSNSGSSTHSNIRMTGSSATSECNDAKATAGPRSVVGEDVAKVCEQEDSVLLASVTTIEGAAPAESEVSTVATEGYVGTGTTTVVKGDAATAEKAVVAAAIKTTGGEFAPPTGGVVAAASHSTRERTAGNVRRKGREKTTGEMPLHAWESLARTVREMRLEAHRLPRAERTAKAEALTLQLAEALGLSDDEDDE